MNINDINKSLAVTGHRPNKLWGYNYNEPHWVRLKEMFKQILISRGIEDAFSGMALGVDMVFAMAVIELKDAGYNIRLHAAIPCGNQCGRWPASSQELYFKLLSRADTITGMSEDKGHVSLCLCTVFNNNTHKNDYVLLLDCGVFDMSFVYTQPYTKQIMQVRNCYMVDNVSQVVAVWDGSGGGTKNCVNYAKSMNRDLTVINPMNV